MALAVALNKIGFDFFKLLNQSFLCYVPAEDGIGVSRVQIEMQTEKCIVMPMIAHFYTSSPLLNL